MTTTPLTATVPATTTPAPGGTTRPGMRNASGRRAHGRLTAAAVVLGLTFVSAVLVLAATSQRASGRGGSRAAVLSGASLLESRSVAPVNSEELRAGRAPAADDEIVLNVPTALARGVGLGDTLHIDGPRPGTFHVVGLVAGESDSLLGPVVPLALGGVLVVAGLVVVRSAIAERAKQGPAGRTSPAGTPRTGARR